MKMKMKMKNEELVFKRIFFSIPTASSILSTNYDKAIVRIIKQLFFLKSISALKTDKRKNISVMSISVFTRYLMSQIASKYTSQ
jgi:hypothetical protein